MKTRKCGRITYAPSDKPCDCFNAVHQCSRNELHIGDHRCTCEHQWDEAWMGPPSRSSQTSAHTASLVSSDIEREGTHD